MGERDLGASTTLFLSTSHQQHEGKSCRGYVIRDGTGASRFTARAFRVPGRITVWPHDAPDRPILLAVPRWSFPLTGRYDVRDAATDRELGVISRSGRFYGAHGRQLGRFRDARSWKEHAGEGLVTLVVEGLIAGDSAADAGTGPSGYVVIVGGRQAGTLSRARVPFEVESPPRAPPGRIARTLRHVLPRRVGDAWFEHRSPLAWKLDVDAGELPEPILLAATLLAIEIALW